GVGAILSRSAVAQNFDAIQGAGGNGVQIDRRRAASDRAVDVDQGRGVTARAVDQHQGLIGRQAAQGGRAHRVGAVHDRRTREVQRRHGGGEGGGQFGGAAVLQHFVGDDIDRGQTVEARAVLRPRAGDDDVVQSGGLVLGRVLRCALGRCGGGGGQRQARGGGEQGDAGGAIGGHLERILGRAWARGSADAQ